MPKSEPNSRTACRERAEQVIATAIAKHGSDGHLNVAAIKAQYPELMPELGERLDTYLAIHAAKRLARHPSLTGDSPTPLRDDDLASLRSAFPAYEICEEIHYGGQGVVYRVIQRATKRVVALKVLLDGLRATERQRLRFEREAELISRLEHPNIVTLFESGIANGRLYYAMQYVDGVPIDDYVLMKDLSVRQIIAMFVGVCRAVNFAHQNGVIHRDLHAANILVDSDGEPHLLDFGLAKDAYDDPDARVSAPGQVVGALPYLSPEQVGAGDGRVDIRSDVYSLGIVLYVLLTESFPYRVQGEYGTVRQEIVARDPMPLRKAFAIGDPDRRANARDISPDLEAIMRMVLAKDKNDRYQSAAALADDLGRFLAGGAVAARAANRLYVLRKALRRYRVPVAVAAVIVASLATSTIVALRALENARAATAVAYNQFDMALETIEESIRPLAGGIVVRDELLQKVSESLPELAERAAADPALRDLTIKLAERQGDIAQAQGRDAEALNHYQRFLDGCLEDWESGTRHDEQAARIIRAYRKLAGVAPEPLRMFEHGAQFAEQAANAIEPECAAALELCALQLRFGEYYKERGAAASALPHLDSALALYKNRSDQSRTDVAWDRHAAAAWSIRGQIRITQGNAEAGRVDLDQSRRMREQQLAIRPADAATRQDLASIYVHLATVEEDSGNTDAAVKLLEAAILHREFLCQMDPTAVTWGRHLFGARVRLAHLFLQLGRSAEAQEEFVRAADLVSRLRAIAPSDDRILESYAYELTLRGKLLGEDERYDDALDAFQEAAGIRRGLLEQDPDSQRRIREMAAALQWVGRAEGRLNDVESAILNYRAACDMFKSLYELNTESPRHILNLVAAQASLAAACLKSESDEHAAEARRVLDEAALLLDRPGVSFTGFEARYDRCRDAVGKNLQLLGRGRGMKQSD